MKQLSMAETGQKPSTGASRSGNVRRGSAILVAVVGALALAAASCVAPPPDVPVANPAGLYANLVQGGFDIAWNSTPNGQANGYQLQYRTDVVAWTDISTGGNTQVTFSDVTDGTRYFFRVRSLRPVGQQPAEFSPTIIRVYVVPVLPLVRIETTDHKPVVTKAEYLPASMTIDPNGTSFPAYNGTLQMKGRGNSTWALPKKPYNLKLNSKASLMGMSSSKKWALLANYWDKSQLRTYAAEQISKMTDLSWTPSYEHVELILNGEYMGVFQLSEKVDVASNRVNIPEMKDTDIAGEALTGGYLLEIDGRFEEKGNPGFWSTKIVPVSFEDPDPPTPEQKQYLKSFVQNFENTLFSPGFKDPTTGYAKYLDVEAFIDHWIVQEVTSNQDSFWSSTKFYKDRGSDKLVFGPIWDFDLSMGNPFAVRALNAEGWFARKNGPWVQRLFNDPAFVQQAAQRWNELAPQIAAALPPKITATGAKVAPAIVNDEARWNYTVDSAQSPEFLNDWLTTRIDWITNAFAAETGG